MDEVDLIDSERFLDLEIPFVSFDKKKKNWLFLTKIQFWQKCVDACGTPNLFNERPNSSEPQKTYNFNW